MWKTRPDFFQSSPPVPYEEQLLENDQYVLRVATLGPKEFFTLQVLSYKTVPALLYVRSNSGPAQQMPFQIQRVFPVWVQVVLLSLVAVGLGFSVYWVIKAVAFVSRAIGIA